MDTTIPADGVVVGVDGTRTALAAVRWAAHEAERRSCPLHLLHAAPYAERFGTFGLRRARGILAVAYTRAVHAVPGLPVSTHLVHAAATPTLIRAAENADLLVLGLSGSTVAAGGAVSHAVQVAGRTTCPTLVMRGTGTADGPVVAGVGTLGRDRAVLEAALDQATLHRTRLVVVTAHERHPDGRLAEAVAALAPQVPVEVRTPATRTIPALIGATPGARMLVIGGSHHGLGGLLGSQSRDLLRVSRVPVLVVTRDPRAVHARPHAAVTADADAAH